MRNTNIHTHTSNFSFTGIDCEMVLSTEGFDILAKVAIVTEDDVLIDSFVRTDLEIEDYRTEVSGVRPEDISSAPHIDEILPQVRDILEDALIIVGHDLVHDMEVLGINFPPDKIRDTAFYGPYLKHGGRSSKLKDLAKKFLGKIIQAGEHDPAEDAKAALLLYFHKMSAWEETVRKREIVRAFHENNFNAHAQNRFSVLTTDDEGSEMNFRDEIFLAEAGEPETLSSDEESFHSLQSDHNISIPEKYDYKTAMTPPSFSQEEEAEKQAKLNEKKKAKRQAKKDKEKIVKAQEKKKNDEKAEKERFLNLSDREKRARQRCFHCGADITGKTPFEYSDNKFCSIGCVKTHRQQC